MIQLCLEAILKLFKEDSYKIGTFLDSALIISVDILCFIS